MVLDPGAKTTEGTIHKNSGPIKNGFSHGASSNSSGTGWNLLGSIQLIFSFPYAQWSFDGLTE